jgi:hypothetical protein
MCQHICNGRAFRTDKGNTQVGSRPKYEVSPPLADVCEFAPPTFADPFPTTPYDTSVITFVFTQKKWPIEIEDVEKGIIIENVDRGSTM